MKKYHLHAALVLATAGYTTLSAQTATSLDADSVANIAKLKKSIEAAPNDLARHEAFLKAVNFTKWSKPIDEGVVRQYENWMKKYPNSAMVAYSIGNALSRKESPKAKSYLLRAVQIDPKFDKAYFDLWIDAERWGDRKAAADYILKARETDPKNSDYAFYYANQFSDTDFEKFKQLSLQVARDFPGTERGAQALYWVANRTATVNEKIQWYEMQKVQFPPASFMWTAGGMMVYFDLLMTHDPQKAALLAEEMGKTMTTDEMQANIWKENLTLVRQYIQATTFMKEGKPDEALKAAEKIVVPRFSTCAEDMLIFKAYLYYLTGKAENAYKNVLTAYVKEPNEKLAKALRGFGEKLGKSETSVDSEVWYARDTAAKQAPNFKLVNYYTGKPASLEDYKGKVVLLTYWFPGCGPCRGEFPHFENVARKFKGKEFVYLGINIENGQDEYVLPFMKSSGYSFIPLRDTKEWNKGALDNQGSAPVNFLIDGEGKILFSNFRIDEKNEGSLEMMINSMLNRKKA